MSKAGSNLKFLRTGLTLGMHVGVAGEVIAVPPDFTPLGAKQQRRMYHGRVFYELTEDEVNVGPGATAKWRPVTEPPAPPTSSGFGEGGTPLSDIDRGGAGATASIAMGQIPSGRPDPDTLGGVTAADLEEMEKKDLSKSNRIVLTRKRKAEKSEGKKKLKAAEPTPMQKAS